MSQQLRTSMEQDERQLAFLQLIEREEETLHRFVRSLLHNRSDADDVYQEAAMIAWRKFDEFEQGTNFRAWVLQIAYFVARNFRRNRYRAGAELSEAFARAVADQRETSAERLDERALALDRCLHRLQEREQELIHERYELGDSIQDMADRRQRSVMAVYKAINRIQHALLACVNRALLRHREQEEDEE